LAFNVMTIYSVKKFLKLNFQVRFYTVFLTVMLFGCQHQRPNLQLPQRSQQGMAVSAHPLASDVGLAVLQQGGNAVDAAAATALAISVVEPFAAGIGGGGFLLLRRAETGTVQSLDFRERAPKRAMRDMYLDKQGKVRQRASLDGHLAAGIPGTVAGLYTVHREYGKLPWAAVVAPAIALAQKGFPVSSRFTKAVERRQNVINKNPAARTVFTRSGVLYKRRSQIQMSKAKLSSEVKAVDAKTLSRFVWESPETTHLMVVDADRNVVSLTFTVNGGFGAAAVAAGTGILLNNEMDDFAVAPGVPNLFGLVGGEANAIAPGKTPLSSMTPIIVTENGKFRLAAGAPGGSTIITTVLQIVLNVLVYDMNVSEAVSAPRIHHQWQPDRLMVERGGFDTATLGELRRRGHKIQQVEGWGNANAIVLTSDGWLEGAADRRGEGVAKGF
jgi:gamma-glutamyltranspeptidase